jgi:hypothetical protein
MGIIKSFYFFMNNKNTKMLLECVYIYMYSLKIGKELEKNHNKKPKNNKKNIYFPKKNSCISLLGFEETRH